MPLKPKETKIPTKHDRLPNWLEADQLAIYTRDREGSIEKQLQLSGLSGT